MMREAKIAYFSMEIGLKSNLSTYSGGLGVLSGDTIRAAADLEIPMVAITLLHRKGYFYQKINDEGKQTDAPVMWPVDDFLKSENIKTSLSIEGRDVHLQAWRYNVVGSTGAIVPVYFLDTNLEENSPEDRCLTDFLYGGDQYYRLCQETVLGIGGIKMLRSLGYYMIERFHMNEGHAALLCLELIEEQIHGDMNISPKVVDIIREKGVFTTHTPVAAGHDSFDMDLVLKVLGEKRVECIKNSISIDSKKLNLTELALRCSRFANGVAWKHGEVSRQMFPDYDIYAITNGVHVDSWVAPSFKELFDKRIPGWSKDSMLLRHTIAVPTKEIWEAHFEAKSTLIEFINRNMNSGFDRDIFTIGFARRATAYKRADLLFFDIDRLEEIYNKVGKFQIVYAGKAHPKDKGGKELIENIYKAINILKDKIAITYLPNYDMALGKLITSGVDVWLNNPRPPMEASGTSGMKAALNGVPSLSVLDGWWIEGHIENVTGWAIGELDDADKGMSEESLDKKHALNLYDKLESIVLPSFYENNEHFRFIMRNCIALNGSYFNTQRMVVQYNRHAYISSNKNPDLY